MGNNPISNVDPDGGWYYDPNKQSWRNKERYRLKQEAKYRLDHHGIDEFGIDHYSDGGSNWRRSIMYKRDIELVSGMKMAYFTTGKGWQSDRYVGDNAPGNNYYNRRGRNWEQGEYQIDYRGGGLNEGSLNYAPGTIGGPMIPQDLEAQGLVSVFILGETKDMGSFNPLETDFISGGDDWLAMQNDPSFDFSGSGLSFTHDFYNGGEFENTDLNLMSGDQVSGWLDQPVVFAFMGPDGNTYPFLAGTINDIPFTLEKSSLAGPISNLPDDPSNVFKTNTEKWEKVTWNSQINASTQIGTAFNRTQNILNNEGYVGNFIVIRVQPSGLTAPDVFGNKRQPIQEFRFIRTGLGGASFRIISGQGVFVR